jgi:hypothetical protein
MDIHLQGFAIQYTKCTCLAIHENSKKTLDLSLSKQIRVHM